MKLFKKTKIKKTINKKMKRRSLQRQILLPFLLLIILAGGAVAYTSYQLSMNAMIDQNSDSVVSQTENLNDHLLKQVDLDMNVDD
ncbi:hypothetical protein ACFQ3N_01220 [Virgibacillus byunsanensis]|uniref:Methyl-accepting chemotaxis protein n=1 Tax=Virgibacillus byunsanensis TaxID=570945 RepID=A0ABW3LG93_9BACI